MNPLLEQFLEEARENLAFIEQNIDQIESGDDELLNSIFRAAHTLKGGSGIVGFEAVKNITHHAEDLLDMLRAGKIDFKPTMETALFEAFDEVMNLVEAAEESEDIVDADEDTVNSIIDALNAEMGKEVAEEEKWEVPFQILKDSQSIINEKKDFLNGANFKVPFGKIEVDEAFCSEDNLYAIYFDVDESCMVYGNDPVYTLSLLADKVVGINSCMAEESAKSILSGTEDEDGLLLNMQLVAYIRASYEEIEDALFNFLDEILFVPINIVDLLQVNNGQEGQNLDVLKEFTSSVIPAIDSIDRVTIREEIAKTLSLIGQDTIQYAQLKRISEILDIVDDKDFAQLKKYIVALESAQVFDTSNMSDVVTTTDSSTESSQTDSTMQLDASKVKALLEQQLQAISMSEGENILERVSAFVENLRPFISDMPQNFSSIEEVTTFIKKSLGHNVAPVVEKAVQQEVPKVEKQKEVEKVEEVKIETPKVEAAVEKVKEVKVETAKVESKKEEKKEEVKAKTEKKEPAKKSVVGKVVKIEQESIDHLMNLIGELLVAKNSLPYLADNVFDMTPENIKRSILEKYTFINRLSEQLQDLIMSMRMLPISYVFDRYPKLVRDISKNLNKKVNLVMHGGETKLDKNIIEMMADPMIHIMRNSLDHGIELPEVRVANGKEPTGTITLKAYAESDKIIIEITDDGAGINVDKVIQKVIDKELLTIDQIDALSDDEKAELVLLPGLSTADVISEYSGRGVGMDVVKTSLENFGGTISIRTKKNVGTTITLSIPVSLAVTSLLHVYMDGIHYGFPMENVAETVKIDKSEIEYLHNEPFVYIRGEVIPLLIIESMLDTSKIDDEPLSIIVLNIKGNFLAVVVNELLGQLDVVQKPLEGILSHHPIFSGTALLGNGQIIMTIDPLGLLGMAHSLKEKVS